MIVCLEKRHFYISKRYSWKILESVFTFFYEKGGYLKKMYYNITIKQWG